MRFSIKCLAILLATIILCAYIPYSANADKMPISLGSASALIVVARGSHQVILQHEAESSLPAPG